MNIEVIDFFPYPIQKEENRTSGTLHVYLIDYEIDIRGIELSFSGNGSLFVKMPAKFGIDHKTKKKVRYPIFAFTSLQKGKDLIQAIKIKAKDFIHKKMLKEQSSQTTDTQNESIEFDHI